MKRFIISTLTIMTCAIASAPPTCPQGNNWNCMYEEQCEKEEVGSMFRCCMTPAQGYCCPAWCQVVKCEWNGTELDCPLESGSDGIDRIYEPIQGPNFKCQDNFCVPIGP